MGISHRRCKDKPFRRFFIALVIFLFCASNLIKAKGNLTYIYSEAIFDQTPKLVVHRGALPGFIPNTREAIVHTLNLIPGATIEIDVRETSDGVLVLLHDPLLDSETSAEGNVTDKKWDELQQHFRRDANGKITNVSITRLWEIIELLGKYPNAELQIESKPKNSSEYDTLALMVLSDPDIAKRIIITSGDLNILQLIHEKYSALRLGWDPGKLIKDKLHITMVNEIIARAKTINAEIIYLDYGLISENSAAIFVQEFHDAGIAVDVWTINDPFKMCQFIRSGADRITTDRADLFYAIALLCP